MYLLRQAVSHLEPIYLIVGNVRDTNYSWVFSQFEEKSQKSDVKKKVVKHNKWLRLDKFSESAKIKCHEISSFQNREIKLLQKFPTI